MEAGMLFQLSKVFAQLLLFGKMSRLAAYCCPVGLEATVIHSCLRPRDGTVLIFKIFSTSNECILQIHRRNALIFIIHFQI